MMSTSLVTGGTGCLGSPLVRRLAAEGRPVRLLVQHSAQGEHLAHLPAVSLIQGDVTRPETLDAAVQGVEVVYHLAAKVHEEPKNAADEREFHVVNAVGTASLLASCKKAATRRLVLVSTVAVYGEVSGCSGDESTGVNPRTAYARSKLAAETMVLSNNGVEGVVLRLPVAYGPGDRGNVGRLIRAIGRRRFFLIKGVPGRRSMVGAENVAAAAVLAGTHPRAVGEVFLVTDGPPISLEEMVRVVNIGLDRTWKPLVFPRAIVWGGAALGSVACHLTGRSIPLTLQTLSKIYGQLEFSSDKIARTLGYQPVQSFQDGIIAEVRWLQKHQGI